MQPSCTLVDQVIRGERPRIKARMMRIKEEEVGTAIEMPIGHHLIDIGLADPMVGILDRRRWHFHFVSTIAIGPLP